MFIRSTCLASIVTFCVALMSTGSLAKSIAAADSIKTIEKDACAHQEIDPERWGGQPFQNPPEVWSEKGILETTLVVAYGNSVIAGCNVRLRNYNPNNDLDYAPIVGPTLRVKPGDTLRIKLKNELPAAAPLHHPKSHNEPHDFNVTNLHTHGLHVSPSGKSDNVLLRIMPGEEFDYEIVLPDDHPAGTFWYHAHVHGSTAIQVSSGMSGAIIVQGGLDDAPEITDVAERVFVLQQIAYGEDGKLEDYEAFSPEAWADSKRAVTINGRIMPVIEMRPGQVERWRLIHSGVREVVNLTLEGHALREIALDGIALGRMVDWGPRPIELHPGYRSDVLVKAADLPEGQRQAVFYVFDEQVVGKQSLQFFAPPDSEIATALSDKIFKSRRILAKVIVRGKPVDMPLPSNASLARYAPFAPIEDDELNGEPQTVSFSIESARCPLPDQACEPCEAGPDCKNRFMVNFRPFSMDHTRQLKLNTASEWLLETAASSKAPNHPFHIHVNPFQMSRDEPNGTQGTVWRDTVMVSRGTPLRVRSRYETFTGKFVLHCHILDHEDQGMMELVEIIE